MMEYCRLCAELKDPDEIVVSITDDEQIIEQKLRVCCQWTIANIEHQLPHSVCSICLNKLDKCWLFTQSVQLAQRRLLEIFENGEESDTKPLAADFVLQYLNNIPSTSTSTAPSFGQQLLQDQYNQQTGDYKCEICTQEFYSAEEWNEHRQQQKCDKSTEIDSIFVDCKVMTADCDAEFDGNGVKHKNNKGLNIDGEQSTNSESIGNRHKRNKPGVGNRQRSTNLYSCDKCGRVYKSHSGLYLHRKVHTGERQFRCEQCNKLFAANSHLKRHLLTHIEREPKRKRQINETLVRPFKCPLCADSFTMKRSMKRHLLIHVNQPNGELKIEQINNRFHIIQLNGGTDPIDIGRNYYKCDECNQIFISANALKYHRVKHSSKRPFECWLCHSVFKIRTSMMTHMRKHVPIKRNLACEICSHEFRTKTELNAHRQQGCEGLIEIGSNAMDCKPTAVDFTNEFHADANDSIVNDIIDIDEHPENSKNDSKNDVEQIGKSSNSTKSPSKKDAQYECGECGKIYSVQCSLYWHKRRKHGPKSNQSTYDKPKFNVVQVDGKRRFQCPLCSSSCTSKLSIKRHLLIHVRSSNGGLKIEETNNRFWIIQSNGRGPIDLGRHLLKCGECDDIYVSTFELNEHRLRKHLHERPYECWLCHKSFKTHGCLRCHLRVHLPDGIKRNSICELCGKGFPSAFSLSDHLKSAHSNERPYKCVTCSLGFKTDSQLKSHSKRHTEEPFKCNQCEKSFRMKQSLKAHLETHTGSIAKPHVCDFCGIGFRRNMDLQDHRRIHTGEMPYTCEHCASKFRARSSYYTHMRTVHGISLLAQNRDKKMAE